MVSSSGGDLRLAASATVFLLALSHYFMGEGEAARRLRSFCKRRAARVRVQQAVGARDK